MTGPPDLVPTAAILRFFKEHQYSYSDMVSINKGSHNIKIGVDVKRNIESSEFNVARPSYEFNDTIFFAADAPTFGAAGVDPGIYFRTMPAQLASNVRHWRNLEFGGFFQDDWKVSRRLTLNLGLRYDLFTRHNELDNLQTHSRSSLGPGTAASWTNITTVPARTPSRKLHALHGSSGQPRRAGVSAVPAASPPRIHSAPATTTTSALASALPRTSSATATQPCAADSASPTRPPSTTHCPIRAGTRRTTPSS